MIVPEEHSQGHNSGDHRHSAPYFGDLPKVQRKLAEKHGRADE